MRIEYNLFRLNQSGVIDSCDQLRFDCDQAALAHAHDMLHPGQVEVWRGKCRVAVIPPAIAGRLMPLRRATDRVAVH